MNELDEMYEAEERADRQKHDDKLKELKNETVDLNNKIRELEDYCKAYNFTQHELHEEIKDLKKENAELKGIKDVATLIRANNDTVITLMQLNNKLVSKSQSLTKAKELLKKWVELFKPKGSNIPPTPIQIATEQFISEVEK